jgi:tRNA modification GTPase
MKYIENEDTIIALSTAARGGAIAVVRLSGFESLGMINQVFSHQISNHDHRRATRGEILSMSRKELIDECVVTYFRAPHSYTGEDVIEISCHCNQIIIDQIIDELVKLGARLAYPGEFTKRAFMNQKVDLSQAEAVASIIDAKTKQSLSVSMRQLEGHLSREMSQIRQEIMDIASLIEISLDFNEDDVQIYEKQTVLSKTQTVLSKIGKLIHTYDYGKYLKEGIKLLILGKPNVGKSSLLNRLVEKERAIVSEIPGTTRDYIEAYTQIEGLPIQLVDTAGIRETLDMIEKQGVQRTIEHMETSDVLLAIFESQKSLDADDRRLIAYIQSLRSQVPIIVVLNKSDLRAQSDTHKELGNLGFEVVKISAKTGAKIEDLKHVIKRMLVTDDVIEGEQVIITNARHKSSLFNAQKSLHEFIQGMKSGQDEVILASELRSALDFLGEIIGDVTSEDLLNNIFSQFCIGK